MSEFFNMLFQIHTVLYLLYLSTLYTLSVFPHILPLHIFSMNFIITYFSKNMSICTKTLSQTTTCVTVSLFSQSPPSDANLNLKYCLTQTRKIQHHLSNKTLIYHSAYILERLVIL